MNSSTSSHVSNPVNKGKILVVDDDRLVLATLSFGLARAGFEVIDADNGDDAILLAREHRPGLVLLDIRMEGLSGFDVAEYLREHLHIPFVFLSAFSDDETLARVKQLGAVAYLIKPLDIRQILPTLEAALARGTAQQAEAPPNAPVLQQFVPIAMGLLMERGRMGREEALSRLDALALENGLTLMEAARGLVEAADQTDQADKADQPSVK